MTNDRPREEEDILLVAPEDRVSGPGSTLIMAAFNHLNPDGDRFTNGTYSDFYAGRTIETAIAETRYHRARFLQATSEPAQEIDMRVHAVDLDVDLHDIREKRELRTSQIKTWERSGQERSFKKFGYLLQRRLRCSPNVWRG